MSDIVWEEPPRDGRGHGRWQNIISELKEHPSIWARVAVFDNPYTASRIGQLLRKYGCEAVSRRVDATAAGVWARWPGDAA